MCGFLAALATLQYRLEKKRHSLLVLLVPVFIFIRI